MINQALILAGGLGIRARALTGEKLPKPLLELAPHVTILGQAIEGLEKIGIKEIFVSAYYQADSITAYLSQKYPQVRVVRETSELGTAGSIYHFIQTARPSGPFLVLPADNMLEWQALKPLLNDPPDESAVCTWGITVTTSRFTQTQVNNNIWYNRQTRLMEAYLSTLPMDQREALAAELRQQPLLAEATSAGVILINPSLFHAYLQKNRFPYPVCLYRDLAPAWINSPQRMKVKVGLIRTHVLDLGTPERFIIGKALYQLTKPMQPLIVAHRGLFDSTFVPNALSSFTETLALGTRAVETDVHQTSDGYLVVRHNHYLGSRLVENTRLKDLDDGTEKALVLADVLKAVKDKQAYLLLDIKTNTEETAQKIHSELERLGLVKSTEVFAKDTAFVMRYKQMFPESVTGLYFDPTQFQDWMDEEYLIYYFKSIGSLAKINVLHLPVKIATGKLVSQLKKDGFKIHLHLKTAADLAKAREFQPDQVTTENVPEAVNFFGPES